MKTETPKKPAAQPAARWNSRALWIAGVPAFVVLTSFVGRSALDRSATASPVETPVRLHHSDEAEDGFKPTKNPLVFVRNAPAPAPNLANGKGYVYLKPGASRADFTAASRKAAAASTVVKNTSAAGGDYLPLSPGQFPYAIAQTSPNGKVTVKCVDPLKGTASEKIEAGH